MKIYKLHRRLSIIIAVPVLLWAISGFMHPIMTNIRPAIATQGIPPVPLDSARIRFPLGEALHKHHMDSILNFRLVHIDTNWFYQVQPAGTQTAPIYISCTNGNVLTAGDWLYAQYLARQFLEGPALYRITEQIADPVNMIIPTASHSAHDCCGAATETVLNPVKGARVANVSMVHAYDNEYKSINRLLPVYRVSFDRPDGIRVYVETTQDRFSFAMDNRRAIFDEIFRLFHTWGWLDFLGKGRLAVELLVALTALFTTVLGIYIFFSTRGSRGVARTHRLTAIVAALFTLMWTFSGSFHAFSKFRDDVRDKYFITTRFAAGVTGFDLMHLQSVCPRPIANISLAAMDGAAYWRVAMMPEKVAAHKDLMKDGRADRSQAMAALPPIAYVGVADYSVLPDGDARYAAWMAAQFSRRPVGEVHSVTRVTTFGDEYNFTDKRLPVWKVSYDGGGHQRWYVETSSGRLASKVDDRMVVEGYSFSIFHKHHFMDWGGKTVRDASTMFWVFMQIVLVTVGLMLWLKRRVW